MASKIRIGSVSYLNAKPLIFGLENTDFAQDIDFSIDYPSRLAQQLIDGQIDIGLVPVATIAHLDHPHIISNYCIASHQKVNSVCIYSDVPMEDIKDIYLDYQSRTSVRLAQILIKEYWKKEVNYLPAHEEFISDIHGDRAGVIIGDRALYQLEKFKYVYDLSEYWYKMTGYDFVFAAWISNKPISQEFIQQFEKANQFGLNDLDLIVDMNQIPYYDLKTYYTQDILYKFDEAKKKGLLHFLSFIDDNLKPVFLS